jgi:hypothetical protein
MKQRESKIVADGQGRLRDAGDYDRERRRILTEWMQRYEREFRSASLWQRLWMYFQLRRAAAAELRKKFPRGALHVTSVGCVNS